MEGERLAQGHESQKLYHADFFVLFYTSRFFLPRLSSMATFVVVVDCKFDQMNRVTDVYLFKRALHLLLI